jgi:hypothetical protein
VHQRLTGDPDFVNKMRSRTAGYYLDVILSKWKHPLKIQEEHRIQDSKLDVEYQSIFHYK